MKKVFANIAIALGIITTAGSFSTEAMSKGYAEFMQVGHQTSAPIGHVNFCRNNPAECGTIYHQDRAIKLTQDNWSQLININGHVNQTIRPVTDQEQYKREEFWTYPGAAGDCEDYALLKRRILINAGWPETALLMTVVKQANGTGHAVLTVRTDRGDLILDNQDPRILPWNKTPYRYIKRQASLNPSSWTSIKDNRTTLALR
ncbi:MAG: transglutaminase-like cysteine peptidase [Cohaesibacter sp.]|nr:transglutaminase-like cysteine peptidase [Cohaesibacter sp.]MCV6574701.1 transglutaminase-like cysteine peptidase [Cohaesibacter sp.]MCV6602361.1 transglutaminase-like cysteine peptidase [Cohaesibacter sp.]